MKKKIILLLIISFICFFSCKEKESKNENTYTEFVNDTLFIHDQNGSIKSKGQLGNKSKKNWWFYYDASGHLRSKIEYKIINDICFENQNIYYKKNNSIDSDLSSFFEIEIADTLNLGKNLGKIKKYNSNFKGDDNLLSVIVKNRYSANEVKNDTFSDGSLLPKFGIFALKKGKQKVNIILLEEVLNEVRIKKDSSVIRILKHRKYFEKEVYVKDTIDYPDGASISRHR